MCKIFKNFNEKQIRKTNEHISAMECAPTMLVPFASFARNSSTFDTVRLKAHTWTEIENLKVWLLKYLSKIQSVISTSCFFLFRLENLFGL